MADTTRLWRCLNPKCADDPGLPGHDFAALEGTCDRCGLKESDPLGKAYIVPLVVIHFDPPHPVVAGRGQGVCACDPARKLGTHRGTGAPTVVNCPACKQTEAYRAALTAAEDVTYVAPAQPCGGC